MLIKVHGLMHDAGRHLHLHKVACAPVVRADYVHRQLPPRQRPVSRAGNPLPRDFLHYSVADCRGASRVVEQE